MGLKIPGFVMFRNFYDKFSLGYVFIYSMLICICLIMIKGRISKRLYTAVLGFLIFAVLFNFIPVKKIVDAPLWQTKDVHRNIVFPNEYTQFMNEVKSKIPPSSNIMNFPMSTAIYSTVAEPGTNNVYVGSSPVKLFSGVNDFSGNMSFSFGIPNIAFDNLVINKQYPDIASYLQKYNIDYLLYTKNIPQEVLDASWIYRKEALDSFNSKFLDYMTNSILFSSSKGNYVLYDLKKKNIAIDGKSVFFTKINQTMYKIYIKNLTKSDLVFNDSYHGGWKLYPQKNPDMIWCGGKKYSLGSSTECSNHENLNLFYPNSLFSKAYFANHGIKNNFANVWHLDSNEIKSKYPKDYYITNPDGSIDAEFILYFSPQNYFLIGVLISALSVLCIISFYLYDKKKNR